MSSNNPASGPVGTALDIHLIKKVLQKPAITQELFLPVDRCRWDGDRYTLGSGGSQGVASQYTGVRLMTPDPTNLDKSREKAVQSDLTALVKSLVELRKVPQLTGVVLSSEAVVSFDPGRTKRVRFGLRCPGDGRFKNEVEAARECHRQILRAISRGRFRIESPTSFNPNSGFRGLIDWASNVRLRKAKVPLSPLWLLGFLPLALLALLPFMCSRPSTIPPSSTPTQPPSTILGTEVKTESLLILLDRSGSMEPCFPKVQAEAERVLNEMMSRQGPAYVDLIPYNDQCSSLLGGLTLVTPEVKDRVIKHLHNLQAGGGTIMAKAIDLAAQEVKQHGLKTGLKTTLIVLTDGEDTSIPGMTQDKDRIQQQFGSVEFVINSTTPRLFSAQDYSPPDNQYEKQLEEFSKSFNGHFGPKKRQP